MTKTVNFCIVYDLDAWPKILLRSLTLKSCLFIEKNESSVYKGYGIVFDGNGEWSFGNNYARKVIIFSIDNSSSSYADSFKNKFLVLDGGGTFGINESFAALKKGLALI